MKGCKKTKVLIVDDSLFMIQKIKGLLGSISSDIEFYTTIYPLEGITLFKEHEPEIVLLDANMPDMNGFALCSILRKMKDGHKAKMYMVTANAMEEHIEQAFHVGFDYYFMKPIKESLFLGIFKNYFESKNVSSDLYLELCQARNKQEEMLPKKIEMPAFTVDYIFSPYGEVSGDFVDFWLSQDKNRIQGFLFDVAGHEIASAMQVFEIRVLFKQGFGLGLKVNEVLSYVNRELFKVRDEPEVVAGLAFELDFRTMMLDFVSAGIPKFFLFEKKKIEPMDMVGSLLGFKENACYVKKSICVKSVSEIIFSSDGFSELLSGHVMKREKHDDVSAVMIRLVNQEIK